MYNLITRIDKERIWAAAETGDDYLSLADQLSVPRNSARALFRRISRRNGVIELQKGGAHNRKLDAEMKVKIEEIINLNPTSTLNTINQKLREALPSKPHVQKSSIAAALDGMLITLKKLDSRSIQCNSISVKVRRKTYSDWFLQNGILNSHIVFIDESGFNLHTTRSRGRSKIDTPATRTINGQRGRNISLLMAISCSVGINLSRFISGSVTKVTFQEFVNDLCATLPADQSAILIMDNAACHNGAVVMSSNHKIQYLPPYSPQLNLIELFFSIFKSELKQQLSSSFNQSLIHDHVQAANASMPMCRWRETQLKSIAEGCLPIITLQKVVSCYNHIFPFLVKGQNLEDF